MVMSHTKLSIERVLKLRDSRQSKLIFKHHPEYAAKFKLLLKWLYKIEARSHRVAYKNSPKIKTDQHLIDGVVKMNASYLSKVDAL